MLITASADKTIRLWKPDPALAPFQNKPALAQRKGITFLLLFLPP